MPTPVTDHPAADPAAALEHFSRSMAFETDCADVNAALAAPDRDFVLVDVRSQRAFAAGHVPDAINIPHAELTEARLASYDRDQLFVVYCAGPHCNGATRGALRLAQLGRPVKLMIGGVTGWRDEGLELVR